MIKNLSLFRDKNATGIFYAVSSFKTDLLDSKEVEEITDDSEKLRLFKALFECEFYAYENDNCLFKSSEFLIIDEYPEDSLQKGYYYRMLVENLN